MFREASSRDTASARIAFGLQDGVDDRWWAKSIAPKVTPTPGMESCELDCHLEYLPAQADARGWGSHVRTISQTGLHGLRLTTHGWLFTRLYRLADRRGGPRPGYRSTSQFGQAALASLRRLGLPRQLGGMDNWHDGATLTVEPGIPAICLGPGEIRLAHTTDESVVISGLVGCAQALEITAIRYWRRIATALVSMKTGRGYA